MNGVFCIISFIFVLIIFVALTMYLVLKKISHIRSSSEYIVNRFEPDNTASKLTELIEFHKLNQNTKYYID